MTKRLSSYDVVVLGAGAAGLMCAAEAAKTGRRVCVLEHQTIAGRKIRISGGGRCNFTNRIAAPEKYHSRNPRFCASALARYTPEDFIDFVRKHSISFHEKKDGQLFCDGSARQIIDMLLAECADSGVVIETDCAISDFSHRDAFFVDTTRGPVHGERLVVATGGLSIPKLGATDLGYRIARRFGHKIIEPTPGLVPLLWNRSERGEFENLAGVSLTVNISTNGHAFEDELLFTHRGLSGPAVLQISSCWNRGDPIVIDLLPHRPVSVLLAEHRQEPIIIGALLCRHLPRRLVQRLLDEPTAGMRLQHCSRALERELDERIGRWKVVPSGTEGFDKAEVTVGGIDTSELSSKTMESKKVPGLHFIGEVVDVTGWLGGYNFQWAWSSAVAAARSMMNDM
jgi:predicted Rossmann fold flavoprotein